MSNIYTYSRLINKLFHEVFTYHKDWNNIFHNGLFINLGNEHLFVKITSRSVYTFCSDVVGNESSMFQYFVLKF